MIDLYSHSKPKHWKIPLILAQIMTCLFASRPPSTAAITFCVIILRVERPYYSYYILRQFFIIFRVVITFLAVCITFWGVTTFFCYRENMASLLGGRFTGKLPPFPSWEITTPPPPPFWGLTRPRCMKGTVQQNFTF